MHMVTFFTFYFYFKCQYKMLITAKSAAYMFNNYNNRIVNSYLHVSIVVFVFVSVHVVRFRMFPQN